MSTEILEATTRVTTMASHGPAGGGREGKGGVTTMASHGPAGGGKGNAGGGRKEGNGVGGVTTLA